MKQINWTYFVSLKTIYSALHSNKWHRFLHYLVNYWKHTVCTPVYLQKQTRQNLLKAVCFSTEFFFSCCIFLQKIFSHIIITLREKNLLHFYKRMKRYEPKTWNKLNKMGKICADKREIHSEIIEAAVLKVNWTGLFAQNKKKSNESRSFKIIIIKLNKYNFWVIRYNYFWYLSKKYGRTNVGKERQQI